MKIRKQNLELEKRNKEQKIPAKNRDLTFQIQTYLISTGTEILSQSMVKPFLLIL